MPSLMHRLASVDEAAQLILQGRPCCVAGDEALLRQLPHGCWIGGTIPYFMGGEGGTCDRQHVFVTELPRHVRAASVQRHDRTSLRRLCLDAPEHGFSILVLPAFSEVHEAFAQEAPDYEDMYLKPLVGWVSGAHLSELGGTRPKVVDGRTGELLEDQAVVLHVPLPTTVWAQVDIVNLFEPGPGAVIEFDQGGFSATGCRIDGQPGNLHDWLVAQQIDTRLPLVADYHGAMVNVSVKALNGDRHSVDFYAPVFPNVAYRVATPVADYARAFAQATASSPLTGAPAFCCNCILNYLYGDLEGRSTGLFQGPMTFGEIGYQLLNQTLVHLSLCEA